MATAKCKKTDLPRIKKELIAKQNGVCPICKKDLTRCNPSNIAVDHDHSTGFIRAAMHKGCNGAEGKVLKQITTWGKAKGKAEAIKTLENIIAFWKLHKTPQTNLIHYKHKTEAEKRVSQNKKRRLAAKKRREAKNV